ncbi:unnamed protein product, partial [Dovyalis caffra]
PLDNDLYTFSLDHALGRPFFVQDHRANLATRHALFGPRRLVEASSPEITTRSGDFVGKQILLLETRSLKACSSGLEP